MRLRGMFAKWITQHPWCQWQQEAVAGGVWRMRSEDGLSLEWASAGKKISKLGDSPRFAVKITEQFSIYIFFNNQVRSEKKIIIIKRQRLSVLITKPYSYRVYVRYYKNDKIYLLKYCENNVRDDDWICLHVNL